MSKENTPYVITASLLILINFSVMQAWIKITTINLVFLDVLILLLIFAHYYFFSSSTIKDLIECSQDIKKIYLKQKFGEKSRHLNLENYKLEDIELTRYEEDKALGTKRNIVARAVFRDMNNNKIIMGKDDPFIKNTTPGRFPSVVHLGEVPYYKPDIVLSAASVEQKPVTVMKTPKPEAGKTEIRLEAKTETKGKDVKF